MSRLVWNQGNAILEVAHDEDGDWSFGTGQEARDDEDIADWFLIHLHHVVEAFPDLLEFADLPIGWIAVREVAGASWDIRPLQESDFG